MIAAALALAPSLARAADAADGVIETAERKAGEGAYLEAARLYVAAYELRPEPVLLKNAAVTFFAAEDCPAAERTSKRYLAAAGPDAPALDGTEARTVLVRCRLRAAEISLAADDPDAAARALTEADAFTPEPAERTRLNALRARVDAATTPTPVSAPAPVPPTTDVLTPQEPTDPGAPAWVAPTGYALLGVGALGLGAVVVRGALWNSAVNAAPDDFRFDPSLLGPGGQLTPEACVGPDASECRDLLDRDGFLNSQLIFGSIAGAVLLTGAALTVWSWSDDDDTQEISVGMWGQGARVSARF